MQAPLPLSRVGSTVIAEVTALEKDLEEITLKIEEEGEEQVMCACVFIVLSPSHVEFLLWASYIF